MVGRVEVFIVKGIGTFIADKMEGEWSAQSAKGRQCAALYVLPDIWLPVVAIDLLAISPIKARLCSRAIRRSFFEHCFIEIDDIRSEEHTSELQSLMRISYAVFCLKKKK